MNQNKPAVVKKLQERFRNVSVGRGLYMAFVMPTMLSMFSTSCFRRGYHLDEGECDHAGCV